MGNKQRRLIKLHSKYRQSSGHWSNEGRIIPWLNVSGLWLEQAGFKPGQQVEITVLNNQLIIKKLSANGAA